MTRPDLPRFANLRDGDLMEPDAPHGCGLALVAVLSLAIWALVGVGIAIIAA